jgi:predicted nuclease of predicted toxin-antitoxin system
MPWVDIDELLPPLSQLTRKEAAEIENYRRTIKRKPRFYVDEDVPSLAVEILREWKFNVLTAEEAGRRGHPDENHLAEARKQDRTLITCDRDYLNERRFPLNQSSALIVCAFGSGTRDQIIATFQCLYMVETIPDYFDEWVKMDAKPSEWTIAQRFMDGTTARTRHRLYQGELQEWVEDIAFR